MSVFTAGMDVGAAAVQLFFVVAGLTLTVDTRVKGIILLDTGDIVLNLARGEEKAQQGVYHLPVD